MEILNLDNHWKMQIVGEKDWIPAKVPGSVYDDLIEGKKLEDPYWRDNELKELAVMENEFLYLCYFAV